MERVLIQGSLSAEVTYVMQALLFGVRMTCRPQPEGQATGHLRLWEEEMCRQSNSGFTRERNDR